ncbi:fluoride efflux transporter FluC [Levilactobacillus namurensis]|uniref:Fluoride-specific ion channel FluC n=1 Tax=Levilactobacillus namurensis TaxID=380393 RepID=A0AAW8W329_9LACO|nr:CrcB family protein [Levilactobacillus namurensis]MDT7012935.1 CrcB family protein [Levilactobacillus namurensis]
MKKLMAIFLGALVGSALRYLLTPVGASHHLLTVMAINIGGCLLLPLVTGALPLLVPVAPHVVTGLSVGLVGSFTTFSTFALDAARLLQAHAYWTALGYVGGSLLLGWLAATGSLTLTHRWVKGARFR